LHVEEDGILSVNIISISNDDVDPFKSPGNNICITHPQYCHLILEIEVSHGVLEAIGVGSTVLIFRGSLKEINYSLETLVYEPDLDYIGNDCLSIVAKNTNGLSSREISISVLSTNDAPKVILQITSGSPLTVWEDLEGVICDEDYIDTEKSASFIT
jgi:hypothetical protein